MWDPRVFLSQLFLRVGPTINLKDSLENNGIRVFIRIFYGCDTGFWILKKYSEKNKFCSLYPNQPLPFFFFGQIWYAGHGSNKNWAQTDGSMVFWALVS
jgi:hypothetical protein